MYLKEAVLDGFKSYATRTVVSGFDPSFNAITGLNGSGKSNILDSICFVLGISNLSQVRASSLQELVYKGGQAGVTKATVTLVFDNEDKKLSPVGYERFPEIAVTRQIVIGGRNKYLVNGHVAQPTKVANLFHSVGLNVNNPHFLIMQGRITKVINMKPEEILSMVEEAAGTRMYENKKDAALRTIERKERKVKEINELLQQKINPSLEKLKGERAHYMEWASNKSELERLEKYILAYRYHNAQSVINSSDDELRELKDESVELASVIEDTDKKRKKVERMIKTLLEKQDSKRMKELSKLEKSVENLAKQLVKEQSCWQNQKKNLESERQYLADAQRKVRDTSQSLEEKKEELEGAEKELSSAQKTYEESAEELQAAETALLTGAGSQGADGTATGSLVDQLDAARRAASLASTDIQKIKLEIAHSKKEASKKQVELNRNRGEVANLESRIRTAENEVAQAKLALHELDFNQDEVASLSLQLSRERDLASKLKTQVDELSARLSRFSFSYSDPEENFNHRKVKGRVAKLIRVKDNLMSTAIEVTAGGRLYQVVVDSDHTGKLLLKRGRLPGRVTILPLNKIVGKRLPEAKLDAARKIEPRVALAIDLIDFEAEITPVMEYIFGQTLVSPDINSARDLTFDKSVYTKTVTPDGEVFDPSGTLSGGSLGRSHGGASLLAELTKLSEAEGTLERHYSNISKLSSKLGALEERSEHFRQLQSRLELKQHDLDLLKKHLEESPTGRLVNEVNSLKALVSETLPQALEKAQEAFESARKRVEKLEGSLDGGEAARSLAEAEAQSSKAKIQERHDASASALQSVRDAKEAISADLEAMEEDLRIQRENCERLDLSVKRLEDEARSQETKVNMVQTEYEEENKKFEEEKRKVSASQRDVSLACKEKDQLAEKEEVAEIEKKKVDLKIKNLERERLQSQKLIESFEENYQWILTAAANFGVVGGEYDFQGQKVDRAREALERLKAIQETLESKINKKAMAMFENAESEYQDLMNKKRIVERDRAKIERVITELDEKKNEAVKATWERVNRSFGEIFSTLLPGTNAKLEPPENKTFQEGLEIRVAFGKVWKESLSELSGGQRSLIALSLILAMLRFKPAPMYILDEVDAALDLSHTQNIGRMLRKHFRGSQFIVVSLKEGMFQNANIIFRTKFIDGVSTITRTSNQGANDSDSEEAQNPGEKLDDETRHPSKAYHHENNKENIENRSMRTSRKRRLAI